MYVWFVSSKMYMLPGRGWGVIPINSLRCLVSYRFLCSTDASSNLTTMSFSVVQVKVTSRVHSPWLLPNCPRADKTCGASLYLSFMGQGENSFAIYSQEQIHRVTK